MADEIVPSEPRQSGFPQSPSEFDDDPRISFSKLEEKYLLETDTTDYEWDSALRRWIPVLDQSLLEEQGRIYHVEGVDDTIDTIQAKKRKANGNGKEAQPKTKKARVNTAIYVTSIPLDANVEEVNHVFSKCGVVAEEIDSGKPRIKMYEDDKGQFKGDALIVYFRPESVNLAIQMLDDSDFRLGVQGPAGPMRVQAADFSYKSQQDVLVKSSKKDQKKIIKKTQKLNSKLADWDDDDPATFPDTSSRWDRVVILKHMFTLEELEEDPAAILEIKEDIREECAKLGTVTNVVLFDRELDGIASVRFATPQAAAACVRVMHGRWFESRQVEATIADGSEKYRKSDDKSTTAVDAADKGTDGEDRDEAEAERLDRFGEWLQDD